MLFGQNRDQLRQVYLDAWRKFRNQEPMQPLEQMIAEVIRQHPEYHKFLESGEAAMGREYLPEMGETNPFLHMGLHLALQEQLQTDRPAGIRQAYKAVVDRVQDPHEAEHRITECLAEVIWSAQRAGGVPDERDYLAKVRRLAHG